MQASFSWAHNVELKPASLLKCCDKVLEQDTLDTDLRISVYGLKLTGALDCLSVSSTEDSMPNTFGVLAAGLEGRREQVDLRETEKVKQVASSTSCRLSEGSVLRWARTRVQSMLRTVIHRRGERTAERSVQRSEAKQRTGLANLRSKIAETVQRCRNSCKPSRG